MEVYSLGENGNAKSVYKSRRRYDETMYVNMYEQHMSYIRDFKLYAKKYECDTCEKL